MVLCRGLLDPPRNCPLAGTLYRPNHELEGEAPNEGSWPSCCNLAEPHLDIDSKNHRSVDFPRYHTFQSLAKTSCLLHSR